MPGGERKEFKDVGAHNRFDPEERDRVLKNVALRVAGGYTILFIVFMLVLALYFGAVWDPQTKDLRVLIINKDRGFTVPGTNNTVSLGQLVANGLINAKKDGERIFHFQEDPTPQDRPPGYGNKLVNRRKYWGVLTIPENYTITFVIAATNTLPAYDNPILYDYNQARQKSTSDITRNGVVSLIGRISVQVGTQALSGAIFPLDCDSLTASAIVNPVYLETYTDYPVEKNGQNFVTYMGVTLMWTVSISLLNISMMLTRPLFRQFTMWQVYWIRIGIIAAAAFFQAMWFLCIVKAYSENEWAHNFGEVLMWVWFMLLTFQTLLAFLIRGLGIAGMLILSPLLVLQITTSNALIHSDMMPDFYGAIGQVLPFYHSIEGLRFLLLGQPCCEEIGTNIGVLLAYFFGFLIIGVIMNRWNVHNYLREKQQEQTGYAAAGNAAALAVPSTQASAFAGGGGGG